MYRVYVRASKGGKTECLTVLKRIGRQFKKKIKSYERLWCARDTVLRGGGRVRGAGVE